MKAFNQFIVHTLFLSLVTSTLVGCGYQLRGTVNSIDDGLTDIQPNHKNAIYLEIADNRSSQLLIRPLKKQLSLLGFSAYIQSVTPKNSVIAVDNVSFREFELVGVLTEVRVVLMAEVTYKVRKDGRLIAHKQPLQIERSYQYNEASVGSDKQNNQIKQWLYEALATRITDQYIALSMQN